MRSSCFELFGVVLLLLLSVDNTDAQVKTQKVKGSMSKLHEMMDKVEELQGQLSKYIKDVDRLAKENDDLRATVRHLKASNDSAGELGEKAAAQSEDYFKREASKLAVEIAELKRTEKRKDADLKDCKEELGKLRKTLKDHQSQKSPVAATATECIGGSVDERPECLQKTVEKLEEKVANCEETVNAVRERCDKDGRELKRMAKDNESLLKGSQNCTGKLADCDNQKSYLEFLKRGYEVVVAELEGDTKTAKEDKEKCEQDAKVAIKGIATYRLYLAVVAVLVVTVVTVKLYSVISLTIHRRTTEAKTRDKMDKTKRQGRRTTQPNTSS